MNSSTVWKPLPRGPSPSMDGIPMDDEVLASEPPPTSAASPWPSPEACAQVPYAAMRAAEASVRSSGSRATPPFTSIRVPGTLAAASSVLDQPLPPDAVAIGEVGLAGELRPVGGMPRRLAEAARLGFRSAVVPRATGGGVGGPLPAGLEVIEAPTVSAAVRLTLGAG